MNTYLTIITTVLVLTQLIRITQNHISLFRQEKKIEHVCGWLKDNDVSEKDFLVQREVFYMLHDKLESEKIEIEKEERLKEYRETGSLVTYDAVAFWGNHEFLNEQLTELMKTIKKRGESVRRIDVFMNDDCNNKTVSVKIWASEDIK